jgi:UDP-GlcNAc3NAcA epimerase
MKIATIVGARPQFIKAATLSRAIAKQAGQALKEVFIHTGQHYDSKMSDIFFEEMELPRPHYHLGIGSGSHGAMTGKMLEAIEQTLLRENPDWVVVYGDTNSTLAGALAAAKLHYPLAHVEAGLRSFNKKMPEELNRILTDHAADLLFTPTPQATQQLHKEGICSTKIAEVGDVMYEAALHYRDKAYSQSSILDQLHITPKQYILATIHRAENTDTPDNLQEIVKGFCLLSEQTPVVWPVHPRTRQVLEKLNLLSVQPPSLILTEPVGYLDMLTLETHAKAILTDSGGVQKEAYFFKVPCLTLRAETEWTELVEHGFNRLVPINAHTICETYSTCLQHTPNWDLSLYGKGDAANKILERLTS